MNVGDMRDVLHELATPVEVDVADANLLLRVLILRH